MTIIEKILRVYHELITRTTPNKMIKTNFFGKSIIFFIISIIFLIYGIIGIIIDKEIWMKNINYEYPNLESYEVGLVKKNGKIINYNNNINDNNIYNNTVKITNYEFQLNKYIEKIDIYISIEGFSQNSFIYKKQDPTSQIKTGESSEKFNPFYKTSEGNLIFPAGIMAHTFLQDTFELYGPNGIIEINTDNIIIKEPIILNKKSRKKLLKYNVVPPSTWQGKLDKDGLADISDPRFQSWINLHTLNNFSKKYGQYRNLNIGIYTLKIKSTFPYGNKRKIKLIENTKIKNVLRGKIKGIIMINIAICNILAGIFYLSLF